VAVLEEGDAARLALVEEAEEAARLGGGVLEAELLGTWLIKNDSCALKEGVYSRPELLAKDAKLEVVEIARAVRVRVLKELLDAEERDVAVDARALHLIWGRYGEIWGDMGRHGEMLRSMHVRCTCSTKAIVARSSHAMTKLLPTIASGIAMSTYADAPGKARARRKQGGCEGAPWGAPRPRRWRASRPTLVSEL